MLRVALTGGLGAGKSTASRMFRQRGAHVLSSDEIGRELMQPGHSAYLPIVKRFGAKVLLADGTLDRPALTKIAFNDGRVEELNSIIHPVVIECQAQMTREIAAKEPTAVVMVESALIFETKHAGEESWRQRFDKIVLVTASEKNKIARFVARSSTDRTVSETELRNLEAEALRRIARQIPDEQKISMSDYVLTNDGAEKELEDQVDHVWPALLAESARNLAANLP